MDGEELTRIVAAAGRGDQTAWNRLVAQYQPMMRAIARAHRLNDADIDDVCQTAWLQLYKHIGTIVEARAISGWLATTTKRAALSALRSRDRTVSVDAVLLEDREVPSWSSLESGKETGAPDERLLQAEHQAAVRASVTTLSTRQRAVLGLLAADPPIPYVEISRRLGVPIGSIGPIRVRGIQRLRQAGAIRALLNAG
jgi:RNA polymerase sigma factor (sigma-70 family)